MTLRHLRTCVAVMLSGGTVLALITPAQAEDVPASSSAPISVRLVGTAESEQEFQLEVSADPSAPMIAGEPVSASWIDPASGLETTINTVAEAGNIARFQILAWKSIAVTVAYGTSTTQLAIDIAPPRAPIKPPSNAPMQQLAYRTNLDPPAVGKGANSTVTMLSPERRASMNGRSWHRGCISMDALREVQVNYWGVDGYRHRGVLIANAAVVPSIRKAFTSMYTIGYRFRSMHPVDVYGKNSRSIGANDYASMAAGNTSMFNCRYQVTKESSRVWSPHATGRSLDINPWENPYLARGAILPNRWWFDTRASSPLVIRGASPVTKILRANGWRWGAWFKDYHHFDYRG